MNRLCKYVYYEFGDFEKKARARTEDIAREDPEASNPLPHEVRLGRRSLYILAAVEQRTYSQVELFRLLRKRRSPTGRRGLWSCFNEVSGELRRAGKLDMRIDREKGKQEMEEALRDLIVERGEGIVTITWGGEFLCSFVEDTQNYMDPFVRAAGGFKWSVGGIYNWCSSPDILIATIKSRCFELGDSKKWRKIAPRLAWENGPSVMESFVDHAIREAGDDSVKLDKMMRLKGLSEAIVERRRTDESETE